MDLDEKTMVKQEDSRNYNQMNIHHAFNNLRTLSVNQRKKREYLSSVIIEIHSSDSELEEKVPTVKICKLKSFLPLTFPDTEDSGNESDVKFEKGKINDV